MPYNIPKLQVHSNRRRHRGYIRHAVQCRVIPFFIPTIDIAWPVNAPNRNAVENRYSPIGVFIVYVDDGKDGVAKVVRSVTRKSMSLPWHLWVNRWVSMLLQTTNYCYK
jgi:hypothetical protein